MNCRPYLLKELNLLKNVKVLVPLGQIALTQTLQCLRLKGLEIPALAFGHGKVYSLPNGHTIITTYHPSQQNTLTGKLTIKMFDDIWKKAKKDADNHARVKIDNIFSNYEEVGQTTDLFNRPIIWCYQSNK